MNVKILLSIERRNIIVWRDEEGMIDFNLRFRNQFLQVEWNERNVK